MNAICVEFDGEPRHRFGGPSAGVYVVYDHRGHLKYIGSTDRLWDRLGSKHVAGDDNHAVQRAYKPAIPDRDQRRLFLRRFLHVSYKEFPTLAEAQAFEKAMLQKYQPAWNIKCVPGRTSQSECLFEPYDHELMKEYVAQEPRRPLQVPKP